jgi:hypothetical protein
MKEIPRIWNYMAISMILKGGQPVSITGYGLRTIQARRKGLDYRPVSLHTLV